MEKQLVIDAQKSYWAVCVTTAASTKIIKSSSSTSTIEVISKRRGSIDYKAVLSPEDFEIYAALRELRKTVVEAEGVPAYVVFTNAQLASSSFGDSRHGQFAVAAKTVATTSRF